MVLPRTIREALCAGSDHGLSTFLAIYGGARLDAGRSTTTDGAGACSKSSNGCSRQQIEYKVRPITVHGVSPNPSRNKEPDLHGMLGSLMVLSLGIVGRMKPQDGFEGVAIIGGVWLVLNCISFFFA